MLKNSPSAMSSERSSTATMSPKRLVTRSRRTSTSDTRTPLSSNGRSNLGAIMPYALVPGHGESSTRIA